VAEVVIEVEVAATEAAAIATKLKLLQFFFAATFSFSLGPDNLYVQSARAPLLTATNGCVIHRPGYLAEEPGPGLLALPDRVPFWS
jgi:hypothetical protein